MCSSPEFFLICHSVFFYLLHSSSGLLHCCNETISFDQVLSNYQCHLFCKNKGSPNSGECLKECELESDLSWNNTSGGNLFFEDTDLASPDIMCQEIVYFQDMMVGKVVLFWNLTWPQNAERLTPLFIIEAQKEGNESVWNFVGATYQSTEEIIGLELATNYLFRIYAVLTFQVVLGPVSSPWIFVLGNDAILGSVSNISAVGFYSNSPSIDAMIDWVPPKDLPCSYRVFWFPVFGSDFFDQKTITLPRNKLPTTLPDLLFKTNYSVEVTPFDVSQDQTTLKKVSWFVTPSCIDIRGKDFTVCSPGEPLNLEAVWLNETSATVTWSQPEHTSVEDILKYSVTVLKEDVLYEDSIVQIDSSFLVPGNKTDTVLTTLHSQYKYFIEVSAMTEGGFGETAKIPLIYAVPSVKRSESFSSLGITLVVVSILLPVAVVVLFTIWKIKHRNSVSFSHYTKNDMLYSNTAEGNNPYIVSYKQVKLLEVLGNGAFGIVHKGEVTWKKRKEIVAVKVNMSPVSEDLKYQLLQEVELMKIIGRHNHIVGLHGCCIDGPQLCLLLEYCPYGDLRSKLISLRSKVSTSENYVNNNSSGESDLQNRKDFTGTTSAFQEDGFVGAEILTENTVSLLLSYMLQVATGMDHLSSLKLVHRDIAARNILLFTEKIVKIGDFGLMRDVYEHRTYSTIRQKMLPIRWMSIEAISEQTFSSWSDVWSFGVLMWEIITLGTHPYPELKNEQILQFLRDDRRLPQPEFCNQELYNVMLSCWHKVPTNRSTFKELSHKLGCILETRNSYLQLEANT